jgi:hypothetical protein
MPFRRKTETHQKIRSTGRTGALPGKELVDRASGAEVVRFFVYTIRQVTRLILPADVV